MTKKAKPATEEPQGIEEIIGKYVDPENDAAVMALENKLIVNSIQVSRENIHGLIEELKDKGITVVVVDTHPSEYSEE